MPTKQATPSSNRKIKLFISHASEDKADFVRPLVKALEAAGFDLWYDEVSLLLGDSLLQKISHGLRDSDYGVVVLSAAFFKKKWPASELDGLLSLEDTARKVILPIWHGVGKSEVEEYSPILAGRLGVSTSEGLGAVVEKIKLSIDASQATRRIENVGAGLARFQQLGRALEVEEKRKELAATSEGANRALAEGLSLIDRIRNQLALTANEFPELGVRFPLSASMGVLRVQCAFGVSIAVQLTHGSADSIRHTTFHFEISHTPYIDLKGKVIRRAVFSPTFNEALEPVWKLADEFRPTTQVIFVTEKKSEYSSNDVADSFFAELADELSQRSKEGK